MPEIEQKFVGIRRVEEGVGGDVVYAKYEASGEHNLAAYVEFFEDAELPASPPMSLDPAVISDEDLRRLVDHLRGRDLLRQC